MLQLVISSVYNYESITMIIQKLTKKIVCSPASTTSTAFSLFMFLSPITQQQKVPCGTHKVGSAEGTSPSTAHPINNNKKSKVST